MRAPASGSATPHELPNVLAGKGGDFYAIEVKSSGGDPVYIDGDEIADLEFFTIGFGAEPKIGVRFDHEDCYFFPPDALHETSGGNYHVKQETAIAEGTDFNELTGHSVETKLDDITAANKGGSDGGIWKVVVSGYQAWDDGCRRRLTVTSARAFVRRYQ